MALIIRWNSDTKVMLLNPTDYTDVNDPVPISSTTGYSFPAQVPIFRIYDRAKRTFTNAEVVGDDVNLDIPVESANAFEVGDRVELYWDLNPGIIRREEVVSAVDKLTDVITITNEPATGETLPEGSTVQAQLGGEVELAETASTPAIDTDTQAAEIWGYEGTIEANHPGLVAGIHVRMEGTFSASIGGNELNDYPVLDDVPVLEQSG